MKTTRSLAAALGGLVFLTVGCGGGGAPPAGTVTDLVTPTATLVAPVAGATVRAAAPTPPQDLLATRLANAQPTRVTGAAVASATPAPDASRPTASATTSAAATPSAAAPASPAVEAAVAALAHEKGVPPSRIAVVSVTAVDWPDSSLGCPEPGRSYAQVITPGYKIVLALDSATYTYHANRSGRGVVRCDRP